ncbi:MAG: hypothetical protein K1X86_09110 [Ignavibacteria bacterium]|nr:hypothetical protein [Ignavibacteria bacterium]
MIDFLVIHLEYFFWLNVILVSVIIFLFRKIIITKFYIFKKDKKLKDILLFVFKILLLFIPILFDWLSNGILSKWINKSIYLYISIIFYFFLIIFFFLSKKTQKPFKKAKIKYPRSKLVFDKILFYLSLIIIVYPISADLYIKQQPEVFFKIISNNANRFFVDTTKQNMNIELNLEIYNNSEDVMEVFTTTEISPFMGDLWSKNFDDSIQYKPPCGFTIPTRTTCFPKSKVEYELINDSLFLPNLFDFPINLNFSEISIDKSSLESCNSEDTVKGPIMAFDDGEFSLGNYYKRKKDLSLETLEICIFWRSRIRIEYSNGKKFTFCFHGQISHQPYVLDNGITAFAVTGNFLEAIFMSQDYLFYNVPKELEKKIYSVAFVNPQKNSFSNRVKLSEGMLGGETPNKDKIIVDKSKDQVFYHYNTSLPLRNDDWIKYYEKQYYIYSTDTNKSISFPFRKKFMWYRR